MDQEERAYSTAGTKKSSGNKTMLVIGVAALLALVAGGILIYRADHSGPIPHNFSSKVSTPLYYPLSLPAGMRVDRTSFEIPAKNVLTFTVIDQRGNKFYVSEEPIPANFDFIAFSKKFPVTNNVSTQVGGWTIGSLSNELVASVPVSTNTWLIINTTAVGYEPELQSLCRAMTRVSN